MSIAIATQVRRWIAAAVQHGGERQRAANKAEAIIGALSIGRDPEQIGRTTVHGESRLRCLKYDLGNGYRLISIRDADAIALVRMDSHDATDRWLDQQQGKTLQIDGIEAAVTVIIEACAGLDYTVPELAPLDAAQPGEEPGTLPPAARLIAPLADGELDDLPIRASDVRALTRLTPDSSDQELAEAVSDLGEIRQPMLQILQFLRNGDNDRARQTLHGLQLPETPKVEVKEPPKEAPQEEPKALSKKQRRAARRAARAERAEADESSFNRMDPERLKALHEKAKVAAEEIRQEEAEARAEQAKEDEANLSFAELLERFERGDLSDDD